jgi:hypothetical protein
MLNDLLPDDEDDDELDDYVTVRSFWPLVRAHDGQALSHEWSFARALCQVARLTLERQYSLDEARTVAQQQQLVEALQDVRQHEPLARHDGVMHPYVPGDWFKVQACLGRVLPLVERLLLR